MGRISACYAICGVAEDFPSLYAPLVESPRVQRAKKSLARNIRRRRVELAISQEEAAHRIGVATRHYQKLEAGTVNVTLKTLVNVSIGLGISLAELFH